MQDAIDRVSNMTDEQLKRTWNRLALVDEETVYGIDIIDWATLLYKELDKRGISAVIAYELPEDKIF